MNKQRYNILSFGSDPEFFIRDNKTNEIVSAEDFIPGDKSFPTDLTDKGHNMQHDNVMVEICIPPVKNVDEFIKEIEFTVGKVNEYLATKDKNLVVVIQSSATLDSKYLKTENALTVGCSVDYNAWLKEENPKVDVVSTNDRWAGGHIHIGLQDNSDDEMNYVEMIENVVKAFDMFLGLPFVVLDPNDDRKHVYGCAGRFRFTPYGFEYRTLSNYWLSSNKLMKYVFEQMKQAISFINAGNKIPDEVKEIIDSVNKEKAIEFCQKYKINLLKNEKSKRNSKILV